VEYETKHELQSQEHTAAQSNICKELDSVELSDSQVWRQLPVDFIVHLIVVSFVYELPVGHWSRYLVVECIDCGLLRLKEIKKEQVVGVLDLLSHVSDSSEYWLLLVSSYWDFRNGGGLLYVNISIVLELSY